MRGDFVVFLCGGFGVFQRRWPEWISSHGGMLIWFLELPFWFLELSSVLSNLSGSWSCRLRTQNGSVLMHLSLHGGVAKFLGAVDLVFGAESVFMTISGQWRCRIFWVLRRWFWCGRYPIALNCVHSWSPDLARFLVWSKSDSIELHGLRESILRSLFLHAEDTSSLGLIFFILEGVDPDLLGFWCGRNPIA